MPVCFSFSLPCALIHLYFPHLACLSRVCVFLFSRISVHNGHSLRLAGAALHLPRSRALAFLDCPGTWASSTMSHRTRDSFTACWVCAAPPCSCPDTHLCHTQLLMAFDSWFLCPSPYPLQAMQSSNSCVLSCPIISPCPITLIFTHLRSPQWQGRGFSTFFLFHKLHLYTSFAAMFSTCSLFEAETPN